MIHGMGVLQRMCRNKQHSFIAIFWIISVPVVVSVRFGQMFEIISAVRIFPIAYDQCVKECNARSICLRFNYYRAAHLCELDISNIGDGNGATSVSASGSLAWEKPVTSQVSIIVI